MTPPTTMATAALAPSQTVGPYFHDALMRADARRNVLAPPEVAGERVRIEGRVLDAAGVGVPDALIEIWQANSRGRYNHPADTREALALDPGFSGYGRVATDDDGRYWFETIKPGATPFALAAGTVPMPMQAPHLAVVIFARGLLNHLTTRLYFADEPANGSDSVLGRAPVERRESLLARPRTVDGRTLYRWDIVLQGTGETVFFNV